METFLKTKFIIDYWNSSNDYYSSYTPCVHSFSFIQFLINFTIGWFSNVQKKVSHKSLQWKLWLHFHFVWISFCNREKKTRKKFKYLIVSESLCTQNGIMTIKKYEEKKESLKNVWWKLEIWKFDGDKLVVFGSTINFK